MYRRHSSLHPRVERDASGVERSFVTMAANAVLAFLAGTGLVDRAERENRRRDRWVKRARKNNLYSENGLNGERAVARRRRQRLRIEARRAAEAA